MGIAGAGPGLGMFLLEQAGPRSAIPVGAKWPWRAHAGRAGASPRTPSASSLPFLSLLRPSSPLGLISSFCKLLVRMLPEALLVGVDVRGALSRAPVPCCLDGSPIGKVQLPLGRVARLGPEATCEIDRGKIQFHGPLLSASMPMVRPAGGGGRGPSGPRGLGQGSGCSSYTVRWGALGSPWGVGTCCPHISIPGQGSARGSAHPWQWRPRSPRWRQAALGGGSPAPHAPPQAREVTQLFLS